jgi:energy-coupling factor transporter ATP-binding protein EcfA2
MVFQDPFGSLDPKWRARDLVEEPLVAYETGDRTARRRRVGEVLELVGLAGYSARRPRELSGGRAQRVAIARAVALNPALIICDEAVSSLDVLIQAQVLNLFERLRAELGLSYLFIAHDLALVKQVSDRVAVMYLGKLMRELPAGHTAGHTVAVACHFPLVPADTSTRSEEKSERSRDEAAVLLEPHHGASYDQILALALATEESGFDAFFRSDHYQGIEPDDTGYRPTDSWTTLAGLAIQTERVRLGTLMSASAYRRPGPLAITVATVDAMSGGRAELGIWPPGSPTSSTAACRTGWPRGTRTSGGSASSPAATRPGSGCPPRCRCAAARPAPPRRTARGRRRYRLVPPVRRHGPGPRPVARARGLTAGHRHLVPNGPGSSPPGHPRASALHHHAEGSSLSTGSSLTWCPLPGSSLTWCPLPG